MLHLGILGSTRGTVMLSLITAIKQQHLMAAISVVLSDKAEALILEHAKQHNVSAQFLDPHHLKRAAYDQQMTSVLQAHQVDLVVLIGYMRILSPEFVAAWRNRIINVHPSLLPAFAGGMNRHVHQAVLASKAEETGCTVHYVTEKVDAGPILAQKKCRVLLGDNVEQLKARVQLLEAAALIEVINQFTLSSLLIKPSGKEDKLYP
jgi:phosphoribosylglycinamide formyltransferase-1